MADYEDLPTWMSGEWSIAAFRDSLVAALGQDAVGTTLSLYFYAVTQSGWDEVREPILRWKRDLAGRTVRLFVGTDHGITDPTALQRIKEDGGKVRIMDRYRGVYHPKVVWLQGSEGHVVWVGSNNLTRDGLLHNVEFALLIRTLEVPDALHRWAQAIAIASVEATRNLIRSYEKQRRRFERERGDRKTTTFIWEGRSEPEGTTETPATDAGNLIVEVMPRETGDAGRQLQLPVSAARSFFGVGSVGSSKTIQLQAKNSARTRIRTMTVFDNSTVRMTISDLEYGDRPCVLVFQRLSEDRFEYEIVPRNIFPDRYSNLLALCRKPTRRGSRRWGVA